MNSLSLLFYLFLFLFILYSVSQDDFVLLRKNVSLDKVFNIAFLTVGVGLFFARFFYVLFHFAKGFLNPVVFFLFPYFPGLFLSGGVLAATVVFYFFLNRSKFPEGHLLDLFGISFFFVFSFALVFSFLKLVSVVILGIVSLILCLIFLRFFQKAKLKDGSIGLLSLLSYSFTSFLLFILLGKNVIREGEVLFLAVLFIISVFFLFKQEKHIAQKIKSLKK